MPSPKHPLQHKSSSAVAKKNKRLKWNIFYCLGWNKRHLCMQTRPYTSSSCDIGRMVRVNTYSLPPVLHLLPLLGIFPYLVVWVHLLNMYGLFSWRTFIQSLTLPQKHAYIVRSLFGQTHLHRFLCIYIAFSLYRTACFAFHWTGSSFQ